MSTLPPIPYASSQVGVCPICYQRPAVAGKVLYGQPVCKKCFYAFLNRRQMAYLVDAVLFAVALYSLRDALSVLAVRLSPTAQVVYELVIGLTLGGLFAAKDGIGGQSPGKWLVGVQVVDEFTGKPIGFVQSFKRNCVLLAGYIPVAGPIASLVVLLVIVGQMSKGRRLGDRFAKTRVIWKKFHRSPVFGGDELACETCGYDLTANASGTCPECGTPLSEPNQLRLAKETPLQQA